MAAPAKTEELYVPELEEIQRSVLGMVLDRHPALVAIEEELIRDLSHPTRQYPVPAQMVRETVASLARGGLAHVVDQRFVIASHSAVLANDLRGAER